MKLYDEKLRLDIMREPIFFGKGRNIQRYDIMKYPEFYELAEKMDGNFWKPGEIALGQDSLDYKELLVIAQNIFNKNLKRQIVWDSNQGRDILATFGRICTNSAFEVAMTRLQFQEVNHSDTYSYILRNVYDNPSDILDTILDEKTITKHTISTMKPYEDFYKLLAKWEYLNDIKKDDSTTFKKLRKLAFGTAEYLNILTPPTEHELKKALWKALIAWNLIEGVRFFVSFACTFAFAENKKMTGNAQELKLIARDEILHLQLTQKLINILKNNEEEGFFEVIEECKEETTQMFRDAANDEIEWANELFEEGSIIGLNAEILTRYMKHIVNTRLRAIREPKMFTEITQNPLPWMDQWLGQGKEEVLPQELEISDYKIGIMTDMEDDEWDDI